MKEPQDRVRVAIVGKYTELTDAYTSIREALVHGGIANDVGVDHEWVASDEFTDQDAAGRPCHFGLRIRPNTESLGAGTTQSVVTAITIVLIVDSMFAVAFSNIGLELRG